MKTKLLGLIACIAMLGIAAPNANANAVYDYTGNDFAADRIAGSTYTTSDFVSISVTLSNALSDNMVVTSELFQYRISNNFERGVQTYNFTGIPPFGSSRLCHECPRPDRSMGRRLFWLYPTVQHSVVKLSGRLHLRRSGYHQFWLGERCQCC